MFESKTITLPKDMLLAERISEVASQLSEWLGSLGKLSDADRKSLRLTKCERNTKGYRYHYSISIGKELSASGAKVQTKASRQPDASDESDTSIETEETGEGSYHLSGVPMHLRRFIESALS